MVDIFVLFCFILVLFFFYIPVPSLLKSSRSSKESFLKQYLMRYDIMSCTLHSLTAPCLLFPLLSVLICFYAFKLKACSKVVFYVFSYKFKMFDWLQWWKVCFYSSNLHKSGSLVHVIYLIISIFRYLILLLHTNSQGKMSPFTPEHVSNYFSNLLVVSDNKNYACSRP